MEPSDDRTASTLVLLIVVFILAGAGAALVVWRMAEARIARAEELQSEAKAAANEQERTQLLLDALRLTPADEQLRRDFQDSIFGWFPDEPERQANMALEAAETAGTSTRLWTIAAYLLVDAGREIDALEAAEHANQLGNLDGWAHEAVGRVLYANERYDEALDHLLIAAADEQNYFGDQQWSALIGLAHRLGRTGEVARIVRARAAERPGSMFIQQALVQLLVAEGNYAGALKHAKQLRAHPVNTPARLAVAWAAWQVGDRKLAAELLRETWMPVSQADQMRALFWAERGDWELANEYVVIALWVEDKLPGEFKPGVPSRVDLWEALIGQAQTVTDDPNAFQVLGVARARLNQRDLARKALGRAVELQPGIQPAATWLATGSFDGYLTKVEQAARAPERRELLKRDDLTFPPHPAWQ